MDRAREDEIRRATKAIMDAPLSASGIIIPPHVAAEQDAPEPPKLNREQRRREERWRRKQAKRAQRARPKNDEQAAALDEAAKVVEHLSEAELTAAIGMVKSLGDMSPELAREAAEEWAE